MRWRGSAGRLGGGEASGGRGAALGLEKARRGFAAGKFSEAAVGDVYGLCSLPLTDTDEKIREEVLSYNSSRLNPGQVGQNQNV